MDKLIYLWIAAKAVFCTCQPDERINGFEKAKAHYKITKIGTLPTAANESSGLVKGKNANSFWTHNDSGGKPELYEINAAGKLLSVKKVEGVANTDWEDLTKDENETIYIGDFGNNDDSRRTLEIYKLPADSSVPERITFKYANQKNFSPSPNKLNYDCEAFFYSKNKLYLFSKNLSSSNQYVKLYELPAEKGNYSISPIDSIKVDAPVTSADISPDGKTFALLTYGKVLLFDIKDDKINFSHPQKCFRIVKKQAEALVFLNNTDMMITNEQGQIFRVTYN